MDELASSPSVALVTGASRGIGAATALMLGREGWVVALNSHPDPTRVSEAETVAKSVTDSGGLAGVFVADISVEESVDSMFKAIEDQLGRVTSIVLNAAATLRHEWADASQRDWDRIMAVNLRGAYFCVRRAFADGAPPDASIVAIGSTQALAGTPDALAYSTAKAGLIGFTRSLSKALGPQGARANCVLPGAIQTEEEIEAFPDQETISRTVMLAQSIPRRGRPEDVASAVCFLLSDRSSFITAQALCVDGGWVPS